MALTITHATVAVIPDDGTSEVGSDEWNANHTISGAIDVVDDTTPQLGGNLDLNSKNITGTGNIDITGSVTVTDEAYDASGWNADLSVPTKNAVRDKIESIGTAVIASGSFTNDEYIELDLPTTYRLFQLIISDAQLDADDALAFVLSSDGGSNYHESAADYKWGSVLVAPSEAVGGESDAANTVGLFFGNGSPEPNSPFYVESIIDPGDTGRKAFIRSTSTFFNTPLRKVEMAVGYLDSTTGRMNSIAIMPGGNADFPPTGGGLITVGVYRLIGIV